MRLPASPILVLVAACLTAAPATVHAHELLVLPVGGGEVDAGRGEPARLLHATLDEPGDELVVTVRATGAPLELQLFVPDRRPEDGFDDDALPMMVVEPAGSAAVALVNASDDTAPVEDPGTSVGYLPVSTAQLERVPPGQLTVRVRRGSSPARIALRVGLPTQFAAENVELTPKAAVRLRAWYDTPAPGAKVDRRPPQATSRSFVAWYGAGVAALGILIAGWWVWSGRRRSRERGAERAAEERRP